MKKYPKIKRIGHDDNDGILSVGEVTVQEKYDGANFRFYWDDTQDRLVFGSRNQVWTLETDTTKRFRPVVEYVREYIDMDKFHDHRNQEGDEIIVFGEAMLPHEINYEFETIPEFVGFDVYSFARNGFIENASEWIEDMGLLPARCIYQGPATEYDAPAPDEMIDSEFYDGPAEGIVIKNHTTGQRAKARSQRFLEAKGSVQNDGGGGNDDTPWDGTALARKFATRSRVMKQIHKYEDDGRTMGMEIMEDLWQDVFEDIINEEFDTIFTGNYQIRTKEFRSEVANITAGVLQQHLAARGRSDTQEAVDD